MKDIFSSLTAEIARQKDHIFLWVPVFIGVGVGLYFALPFEPPLWVMGGAPVLAGCAVVSRHRPLLSVLLLFLFLAALGFAAAQVRTIVTYTPILQKKINVTGVSGTVETVEDLEEGKGRRLLLNHVVIEKLEPERTPVKLRLTIKKQVDFMAGDRVHVLAQLNPPAEPVMLGAFDFQRYMYFQQIGAVGFIYKNIEEPVRAGGWENAIENLRRNIAVRVFRAVPADAAPLSTALVTGHRAAITKEDNQAMQNSGLAHIISISGLHIGIFSAFVFFISRFLMAAVPGLALHRPIKKYAAVLAFLAAAFYTLIAGASIPTERSLIMIGLAYLAILLDRSPLSLRLVAFAAAAVLLVAPESLVSASFQMSFTAVAALVVFFEALRPLLMKINRQAGFLRKAALYVGSVCGSTIVVTLATAPFTLFHFQQLALYGIVANALAVPLTTFVIMPAMVLALLLMPFHLEAWPLKIFGAGVQGVLDIAHRTADLPHAAVHMGAWPLQALVLSVCGLVFIGLWQGWLRVLGFAPLVLALVIVLHYRQPDVLVAPDFKLAGFRAADGKLYVSTRRTDRFTTENWERLAGLKKGEARVWPKAGGERGIRCDAAACRLELKGHRISFLHRAEAIGEECAWAEAVIAFDVVKKDLPEGLCGGVAVFDKFDGLRHGALALRLEEAGVVVETAEEIRGRRPWTKGRPSP